MQNFGSSFKFLIVLELRTEGLIYLFCIWLFLTHLWSIFPFLQPLKSPKNLWSEMDKCCCLLDYHRFKTFLAILLIRKTHWKLCMKYWGISSNFSSIYKRSQEISTQHCKHCIKDFFSKYDQLQFPTYLVTFTEKNYNEYFLYSADFCRRRKNLFEFGEHKVITHDNLKHLAKHKIKKSYFLDILKIQIFCKHVRVYFL